MSKRRAFGLLSAATAAVLVVALPAAPQQQALILPTGGLAHAAPAQQGMTWPGAVNDSSDPDDEPELRTGAVSVAGAGR